MGSEYFGKYSGIVKDNSDDQNLGQLQVSVPALFPPDDLVAARPALPYGLFFVPEKDQRVWVEFEGGDPGLPIWTGVQSIPGAWPDEAKANPPQKRVIKTASGHVLAFDDKSGEEGIQVTDGVNKHSVTLNKDGIQVTDGVNKHSVTLNNNGIQVTDGVNKHSVTLNKDGIQVTDGVNNHNVTLNKDGIDVTKGGSLALEIKMASDGVTVDGKSSQVVLKSGGVTLTVGNGKVAIS